MIHKINHALTIGAYVFVGEGGIRYVPYRGFPILPVKESTMFLLLSKQATVTTIFGKIYSFVSLMHFLRKSLFSYQYIASYPGCGLGTRLISTVHTSNNYTIQLEIWNIYTVHIHSSKQCTHSCYGKALASSFAVVHL